ncbi:MAG: hypothetical protein KHZ15_12890 [Coprobacillus cateniformis]|uniref:Putative zinc binding protein n=2 Tax=Longibaculum muris TaxID=1796628 RepID=A0A4R3YSF4_9FIRM|nr:hypothetical protein [Coprobacillus cateniformis]MBS5369780.1 hypothetical protein [Coprobacillus cateniformis]TCV95332.1 putative zinc binding protein [Longibaculum muris]
MRKCPRCHKEMKEDCYVKDTAQAISDFVVVEKKEDLKKKEFPLKAAVCKSCGYVELYVDVNEE